MHAAVHRGCFGKAYHEKARGNNYSLQLNRWCLKLIGAWPYVRGFSAIHLFSSKNDL